MRSAWFLNGVLVRLAVSLNLHRDGIHFADMTPFEVETRRRLWWQICLIDSRSEAVQDAEYRLSERMFDTAMPANTNDVDFEPEMRMSPVASEKWTDMTVVLLRCWIWRLSRQLQSVKCAKHTPPSNTQDMLRLFQQTQAQIEDTFLKHHEPNQPLHSFVVTSARLFLTKVDLIVHTIQHTSGMTPFHPTDTLHRDKIFHSCLSIIEKTYFLQNEPQWRNWRWQIHARDPPWHALRVVLSQLRGRRWAPFYEDAWKSVKRSLEVLSDATRKDPRYLHLSSLVSIVERHRADELERQQISGVQTAANEDLASFTTPLTLAEPLEQVDLGRIGSTWTPAEPFLSMPDEPARDVIRDDPTLSIDWQAWDGTLGDLEPSFDLWDMSGL